MRLKPIVIDKYAIIAVMDGDDCPALKFLVDGDDSMQAMREGLIEMLQHTATVGLDAIPTKWTHEASKKDKIDEFIKGDLRLFFFNGKNGHIAVCTSGVVKSGQKADKASVKKAAKLRKQYLKDFENGNLTIESDDETE